MDKVVVIAEAMAVVASSLWTRVEPLVASVPTSRESIARAAGNEMAMGQP